MADISSEARTYLIEIFTKMAADPQMECLYGELGLVLARLKSGETLLSISDALFDRLFQQSMPNKIKFDSVSSEEWHAQKPFKREISVLYDMQLEGLDLSIYQNSRMMHRLEEAIATRLSSERALVSAIDGMKLSGATFECALGCLDSHEKLFFAAEYLRHGLVTEKKALAIRGSLAEVMRDERALPEWRVKAYALTRQVDSELKKFPSKKKHRPEERKGTISRYRLYSLPGY